MLEQRRRAGGRYVGAPAEQVLQHRAGPLVGHVRDWYLQRELQVLGREVPGACIAGRAIEHLALLRQRGQFLQVGCRHRRIDDVDRRHLRQQRDRNEVLVHVVRQLREHERVDRQRADVTEYQRVAVRGCVRDFLHRNIAGAARLVVDDHLLAEVLAHLLGDGARDDLGGSARRERDDQANGLVRKRLCEQRCGLRQCDQAHGGPNKTTDQRMDHVDSRMDEAAEL